ncbi:MAG: IS3 family transposase, partial [Alteraurantiacibacter sp.]
MTRYRPAYPPEFRRPMIDLVRSGRTPEELAQEFEPGAASIAGWVRRADAEDGTRSEVITSAEREELA